MCNDVWRAYLCGGGVRGGVRRFNPMHCCVDVTEVAAGGECRACVLWAGAHPWVHTRATCWSPMQAPNH
jgi:hypothetical protein